MWVSWGHGLHVNEYLAVHGHHWSCNIAPPDIEIEISLIEKVKGKWKTVEEAKKGWPYPGEFRENRVGTRRRMAVRRATVVSGMGMGSYMGCLVKANNWYATAEDGHEDECPEGLGEDNTRGDESGSYET